MNRHFTSTLLVIGLTTGLCTPLVASAADVNWVGADGAWEDGATNWSSGRPPGALDFAHILYTGAVSSTAVGNVALEAVNFSTLSVSAGSLNIIGTLDTAGAVNLTGGATMSLGRLGVLESGSFAASGATTLDVVEGIFNYGQFSIADTVVVTAESVDNFNEMGASGASALTANSMINHANSHFGVIDDRTEVTITGAITNDGSIGVAQNGRLVSNSIDNHGSLSLSDGGAVLVETMVNYDSVDVGNLSVPDTAQLTVTELLTNLATIRIDYEASAALANTINHGAITVTNATVTGGALDNRADGSVALLSGSEAQLAETSKNRGQILVDATSTLATDAYQQLEGETNIDGGTLAATLAFGIDITGGSLLGHGTLDGNLITREFGILAPGDALSPGGPGDQTGSFAISGDAALGGLFDVQIADLNDFDWLDIAGSATLGGTLAVELVDGFSPVVGDAFDILLADAISGSFASVLLPVLGGGLQLQLFSGLDFVRLAVVAAPVPVPAALWLFASACGACGMLARRRR